MKNLKTILVVTVFLLAATTTFANTKKPTVKPTKQSLSSQIYQKLKLNSLHIEYDVTAEVLFTLNQDREIVVLYVDTNNNELESFIKAKLNYEKVQVSEYKEGRTYKVPVTVKS